MSIPRSYIIMLAIFWVAAAFGATQATKTDAQFDALKANCEIYLAPPKDEPKGDRSDIGVIGLDEVKDVDFGGRLYRSYIPKAWGNGHPFAFLAKSTVGPRIGVYYDPKSRMATYPDVESMTNRLRKLYDIWGVENGILPELVDGHISSQEFMDMIRLRNRFPYSSDSHAKAHVHDVVSHIFGWVAFSESTQIIRQRLNTLFAIKAILVKFETSAEDAQKGGIQEAMGLLQRDFHSEDYLTLEISSSNYGMRKLSEIEDSVRNSAAVSAAEVKRKYLNLNLPAEVITQIGMLPASEEFFSDEKIQALSKQIYQRWNGRPPK